MFASLLIMLFLTAGIHLYFVIVIIIVIIISDLRTNSYYFSIEHLTDWFL